MSTTIQAKAPEEQNEHLSRTGWNLCRRPWWHQVSIQHYRPTPATSPRHKQENAAINDLSASSLASTSSVAGIAKAFLVTKRKLQCDPGNKLYFPYEPGKQATSAVRIKNVSRSHIAFKFQTTAPKSCFMRPPSGVLAPGTSIIAIVVKFIEPADSSMKLKTKDKFKIVSLKVKEGIEFTPELFDEQKEQVEVEQILKVQFLDPERPTLELEKLKQRITEAEASRNDTKPVPEENHPVHILGDGNVLEEWNKMKLARLQAKAEQ